jgi:hypothetical protein
VDLEEKILADMAEHEKQVEATVAEKMDFNRPSILTFEAACLVLAIERGTDAQIVQGKAIFRTINHYARAHGPHGRWRGARDFLEKFIQHYAPRWNWREEARIGEAEDRNYKLENERIAKERAEDARWTMARVNKFWTPEFPDAGLLYGLAWDYRRSPWKKRRITRGTWPTLRELKLATAIPERELEKIIRRLRPKKTEITKEPQIVPRVFDASRRKFSRRGAVPLRYGPRLIVGVLNEFVNRLPGFPIDDGSENDCEKQRCS